MFTGIVADRGTVTRARSRSGTLELRVRAPSIAGRLARGDSVAVNGVCLTAVAASRRKFTVQVVQETLARSTLGDLDEGDRVNLELPARLSDRLGGHLVQGHVDAVVVVSRVSDEGTARRVWADAPAELLRYIVVKGSVALDGVSLTVADAGASGFEVAVIPHTLETTTLGDLRAGTRLNAEADVLGKYVEKLIAPAATSAGKPKE